MSIRRWVYGLGVFFVSGPLWAQDFLPQSHPKYVTVRKVYTRLVHAFGDGRPSPKLRLVSTSAPSSNIIAWYDHIENTLTLEERAYDLCRLQQADSLHALATILSHEMAHYYKDHHWGSYFGNDFADLDVGMDVKSLQYNRQKRLELEAEADFFGGFAGFLAGYNTLGVSANILQSIYKVYQLDKADAAYASLAERMEIARRSQKKLETLVPVFEAGTSLLLVGRYEEAARCFDYVAHRFPSREILNNAGVARALDAIRLLGSVRK